MTLPANVKVILSFVLMLLGAYGVLFLLSLVVWTVRDIRSRSLVTGLSARTVAACLQSFAHRGLRQISARG